MPTATPDRLSGTVAVSKDSKIKPLGYITWFSVPDRPVNVKTLKKHWLMAGLDPTPLPADPRALYLFKRAMREQEGKVRNADGSITQTEVVDVLETGEHCIYQISRVVRDVDERVVEYPKTMRAVYLKATEEIKYDRLGDAKREEVLPMMEAIQDYFERNTKVVDGRKVRTLVRDFLKDDSDEQGKTVGLSGENLRGKAGGVYFIAARYKDELDGLAQALEGLYEDEGATYGLYTVPLADTASEREMIRRHHVANTLKEIQDAMADVSKLLREDRKNAVRSDVAAHHWRKLQSLRRRAAEYNALLREEQEDVSAASDMLAKQLDKLP